MKNQMISRFRFLAFCFLSLCFLHSCSEDPLEFKEDITYDLTAKTVKDTTLIEGQYIVVLSTLPGKKNPQALAALEALSKEVGQMPDARINRKYSHVLTGFAAKLTNNQVEKLRKDPRVQYIEQDGYVYPTSNISVQEYPTWGLDRIDQRDLLLNRVYANTATGKGVTAYIIDTGIRYSHSEFGGRATLGYDFVLEEDPDNTDPNQEAGEDCWGHGTHVAGTLGGNEYGVAKNVNLISVRVYGCTGRTTWTRVIAAIDWVTKDVVESNRLPAVVNMSLGGPPSSLYSLETAINNSIEAGVNYVTSAGNSNDDACNYEPARHPLALTVGASQLGDEMASFSNYGDCVDIYAPGFHIEAASNLDDTKIVSQSGTSMAAPHVAGVVALYLESNPAATPSQVHNVIVANATPNAVSNVPSGTNSMIFSLWEEVAIVPPMFQLTTVGNKIKGKHVIDLTWMRQDFSKAQIFRNGQLIAEDVSFGWYEDHTEVKGNDATYIHQIRQKVPFYQEIFSNEAITIYGNGGGETTNKTPTANFSYTAELLNVQFTDTSTDSDGTITARSWDFGDGNSSTIQNPEHLYTTAGTYKVSLTVTDDAGATGSTSQNISVSANESAPGDIVLIADGYKVKGAWHADLSWTPAGTSARVDIYRNGNKIATTDNSGSFTDATNLKGGGSLTYKVCEGGNTTCSNEVTVQF